MHYILLYYRNALQIIILWKFLINYYTIEIHYKLIYYRNSFQIIILQKFITQYLNMSYNIWGRIYSINTFIYSNAYIPSDNCSCEFNPHLVH